MLSLPFGELSKRGFKERELEKFLAFCNAVHPAFLESQRLDNIDYIIDLCSGNGLGAFTFLFNKIGREALLIDKTIPKRFNKLSDLFKSGSFNYKKQDILSEEVKLPEGAKADNTLIISVHPCAELTDKVIEIGLNKKIPFAILTCCHRSEKPAYKLSNPPDSRLQLYDSPGDYFDEVRAQYIRERGWRCSLLKIDKRITEKNKVIVGKI